MNWKTQAALATILALLGFTILFNPVNTVTAAGSIVPWLLFAGATIQFLSVFFRSRRTFRLVLVPSLIGALLLYAGASMKFGDPATVGPISLAFVLALVLLGSAAAKGFLAYGLQRSKYLLYILASAVLSALLGLIVFFSWSTVSAGLIGVFIGLELIADAVVMGSLALRERDGEEAMESLGLDPATEAAKKAAAAEAAVAAAAKSAAAAAARATAPPTPAADAAAIDVLQQAQIPDAAPVTPVKPPADPAN
nr:hypothetical protein [Polymorphobacter sp.]